MGYDFDKLIGDTKTLSEKYDIAKVFKIGKSCEGRDILCVKVGEGHKKLIVAGAFHGLESITAAFLVRFAASYSDMIETRKDFYGRDAALLSKNVSFYIVPMVNPDGVEIAAHSEDEGIRNTWQANARGVDINHNFDADWQPILGSAAPSKYGGEYAESEEETKAIAGFIRRELFDMLLCFHSQGEEIYYDFNGKTGRRSKEIADIMAKESGYKVCRPEGTAVFGGCKDWFIKEFGREGFTIEMGKGKNPLPIKILNEIFEPNARIVLCAMEQCLV